MDTPDDAPTHQAGVEGLSRVERSLRRALATIDPTEARYYVWTALQHLVVLREPAEASTDTPWQSPERQ